MSPHASADLSNIKVEADQIKLPNTENSLIIEGAGGLMVPINHDTLYIDLIPKFKAEVILVSRHYLGSINHSLLSAEALKSRNIPVKGILFIGEKNEATEEIILNLTNLQFLGRIDEAQAITKDFILHQSEKFRNL
jgi:dethiobiotin synthetase